jgi:hypothetical protein
METIEERRQNGTKTTKAKATQTKEREEGIQGVHSTLWKRNNNQKSGWIGNLSQLQHEGKVMEDENIVGWIDKGQQRTVIRKEKDQDVEAAIIEEAKKLGVEPSEIKRGKPPTTKPGGTEHASGAGPGEDTEKPIIPITPKGDSKDAARPKPKEGKWSMYATSLLNSMKRKD